MKKEYHVGAQIRNDKNLIHRVMKSVDDWLKSNETFVTDKQGNIIDGLIDCKKGTLLTRIIKAFEEVKKENCPHKKMTYNNVGVHKCSQCGKTWF